MKPLVWRSPTKRKKYTQKKCWPTYSSVQYQSMVVTQTYTFLIEKKRHFHRLKTLFFLLQIHSYYEGKQSSAAFKTCCYWSDVGSEKRLLGVIMLWTYRKKVKVVVVKARGKIYILNIHANIYVYTHIYCIYICYI